MTSKYLVKLKAQRALLIIEKGLLPLLKSSFKIILDGKKKKKKSSEKCGVFMLALKSS